MDKSLRLIIQLKDAENHTTWALTMQYNLRAFGVWRYAHGKLKCPLDDITTPSSKMMTLSVTASLTRDQWIHSDEHIMAYIMRFVSIPICLLICRLTSSKD